MAKSDPACSAVSQFTAEEWYLYLRPSGHDPYDEDERLAMDFLGIGDIKIHEPFRRERESRKALARVLLREEPSRIDRDMRVALAALFDPDPAPEPGPGPEEEDGPIWEQHLERYLMWEISVKENLYLDLCKRRPDKTRRGNKYRDQAIFLWVCARSAEGVSVETAQYEAAGKFGISEHTVKRICKRTGGVVGWRNAMKGVGWRPSLPKLPKKE